MAVSTIIPVPLRRAKQRIIDYLRTLGATSTETAQSLSDLSLIEKGRLQRLLSAGAIHKTESDRYFWMKPL